MTYDTINDAMTLTGGGNPLLAGRYQVVRQLGSGGMGSVWLAEDTLLDNKLFAVKMLPSVLVSNKRAYRQLKDEAIVAMKLVHPNIVQIRAFEENSGNPFLVMDYIEGQTLDDYLAESGQINEEETTRVLRPIAAALDYAHTKGVVHRDVKPGNVMIAKDGMPYILDFGIAREIQETMTRVTGKLSSGTLLYMSPEQLNGDPPKKEQDVYSFAAMVYECLKGELPFMRGAIEDQIKNKIPEPLGSNITIRCSVMQGLAKKPEDRPPTCVAVLDGGGVPQEGSQHQSVSRVWCATPSTETVCKPVHDKVQLWEDGPYWADTNIGAEKPWDSGFYFWWGDAIGHKRINDRWAASDGSSFDIPFNSNPICCKDITTLQREGWITADNVLAPKHDAAQMQWGERWRIPTRQELKDLCGKCSWTWSMMNGVGGYIVSGRGSYSSASIFLPAAGCGYGASLLNAASHGCYWSSVPYSYNSYYGSWYLYFYSSSHRESYYSRIYGHSIRPVQGLVK